MIADDWRDFIIFARYLGNNKEEKRHGNSESEDNKPIEQCVAEL